MYWVFFFMNLTLVVAVHLEDFSNFLRSTKTLDKILASKKRHILYLALWELFLPLSTEL